MKVGDYVRTKRGVIARILKINSTGSITCDRNIYWGAGDYNSKKVLCDLTQIIKSSPNIIDLVEIGDYVNGYYVEDVRGVYDGEDAHFIIRLASGCNYFQPDIMEDIKSIVTKEQFESMEYEVK